LDKNAFRKVTAGTLLVTLGIIYGDIGTSPLYVFKAIIGKHPISQELVFGGLSCIFWTLTIQTSFKYITLVLQADNRGEGGTFALYALVRRAKLKWLVFPAVIGGATLLADGIITPSISVSAAIEGLRIYNETLPTLPIVIAIIVSFFIIQQFGTKAVGGSFGPIMFVWFTMLLVLGIREIGEYPMVLKALNPYYAIHLLGKYPGGFWILGAVFLATTGAEALYSDLGHCGKRNIRITWIFVKTALVLNYLGQGAWLMKHEGELLGNQNPFYVMMPEWFILPGVVIATLAAIVASQAMISGSFTLVNEAIRLNFWPRFRIVYPTDLRGQLYIPALNWLLMCGCLGVVIYFRESSNMEAAYGLAIIITMLTTTILLSFFFYLKRVHTAFIALFLLLFLTVEGSFLVANLVKLPHGGWITLLIASVLFGLMYSWYQARKIRNRFVEFVKLRNYLNLLRDLSHDFSIPKYATHLVYLTSANYTDEIEEKVVYSILQKQPKRADMYWFVHVDVRDEPYTMEYKVTELIKGNIIRVDFRLGFRVEPKVNLMFRKVVEDLVKNFEVDITSRYESLGRKNVIGDFRFVVLEKFLSYENELPFFEKIIMDIYFFFKDISLSEERAFGLDTSSVTVEKVPMIIAPAGELALKRIR
jgi:KUP system potassium uptake protein